MSRQGGARDIGLRRIVDLDCGIGRKAGAGLGDDAAVDAHGAARNGVARPRSAGDETGVQQQLIEADGFCRFGHRLS
jgi:hypothetical protein